MKLLPRKRSQGLFCFSFFVSALFHLSLTRNQAVVVEDEPMADSSAVHRSESVPLDTAHVQDTTRATRHQGRRQPAPVPDSAPSKNLRSSKHLATAGGLTTPSPANPLQVQRAGDVRSSTTHKKDKPTRKPATHVHRLLPSELPSDVGGLQVRFYSLIIILNTHECLRLESDE